jgi:hypothetical protein
MGVLVETVFPQFSSSGKLYAFSIQNLLLPAYIGWRLYNYFIKKENSWLPQFNGKKSWYVNLGLWLLWLKIVAIALTLLVLKSNSPVAWFGVWLVPLAMLFNYWPIILIEIGYFVSSKKIPNKSSNSDGENAAGS